MWLLELLNDVTAVQLSEVPQLLHLAFLRGVIQGSTPTASCHACLTIFRIAVLFKSLDFLLDVVLILEYH